MNTNEVKNIMNIINKEKIDIGMSSDTKYLLVNNKGEKFLLRSSGIAEFNRKKKEFERMQLMGAVGIPMSKPIEFGVCDEAKMFSNY